MGEATTLPENDHLSTFLASFPAKLYCKETESDLDRRVFWSQNERPESKSSSDDVAGPWVIHEKIKSAFSNVNSLPLKEIIIQFWAPVKTTTGRLVLSTSDQPFALVHLNTSLRKYRLSCTRYKYALHKLEEDDKKEIITGAPAATAFLTQFPKVILKHQQGASNSALENDLTCSIMLPVFNPSQSCSSSSCVGVVECSMNRSGLLVIFNELKSALERVGLVIYHLQESRPYKPISSLKLATNEVQEALEVVCESHALTFGQVWIAVESEKKQKFLVKLIGYCVESDNDPLSCVKDFYKHCDMPPLKLGEGIAGKAIQKYKPHFCKNLNNRQITDNEGLFALLSANTNTDCSCYAVTMRSSHTGVLDYVFEFLWPESRDHVIVLESVLLTLTRCLPSFKFAFRKSDLLGTAYDTQPIRIIQRNRSSQALKETRGVKRKLSDLYETKLGPNQESTHLKEEDDCDHHDDDNEYEYEYEYEYDDDDDEYDDVDLVIVAYFKELATLFVLPGSSTLAAAKEKIDRDFDLNPGTYKLKYERGEQISWFNLDDDLQFKNCIRYWRRIQKTHIKVRVHMID